MGGLVAWEMAQQLMKEGEKVSTCCKNKSFLDGVFCIILCFIG